MDNLMCVIKFTFKFMLMTGIIFSIVLAIRAVLLDPSCIPFKEMLICAYLSSVYSSVRKQIKE